jgi:hypothetical protein
MESRRVRTVGRASSWVALACALACGDASGQQRLVLTGATLIDGVTDEAVQAARIVVVEGRFSCVSGPDGCPAERDDREVDLSDRWVTAGLIDTHAHLDPVLDPERTARAQALRFALGVTTVRDAGSLQFEALLAARLIAADGSVPVPRIVIAARPVEQYAEQFGVAPGRALVRRLVELGADGIKIKDHVDGSLWEEEITAAVELGVPVWGHVVDTAGPPPIGVPDEAIAAGVSGISHLNWIVPYAQGPGEGLPPHPPEREYYGWLKSHWHSTDSMQVADLIAQAVTNEVWLEPMLVTEWYWWKRPLNPPPHLFFLRQQPPSLRDLIKRRDQLEEETPATFPAAYEVMSDFVRAFHDAGGILVTGTDEVRPGLGVHSEIALLTRAGLSPMESLRAATVDAAHAMGRDDVGTIEVGRIADAVVHLSDPLANGGTTLDVISVMKGGVIHDSNALLEPFRARYRERVRALWIDRLVRFGRLGLLALLSGAIALWCLRRVWRHFRSPAAG